MIVSYSTTYDGYFPYEGVVDETVWSDFASTDEEFTEPISELSVDFSLKDQRADLLTKEDSVSFFQKTFVGPLQYGIQRFVMMNLYPAQNPLMRFLKITKPIDKLTQELKNTLSREDFLIRHIVFERNKTRYSGYIIGKKNSLSSRKWALVATGNNSPVEAELIRCARIFARYNINVCAVNGPSVGRSEGLATPKTIGEVQDLGICFLENAVKANKIILDGISLGAAALSQAILIHKFKREIKYLVIREMSFDLASNICGATVGRMSTILGSLTERLVIWSGCEMDSVAASEKLQEQDITEIIIQRTDKEIAEGEIPKREDFEYDGRIFPEATLAGGIIKSGYFHKKIFIGAENRHHVDPHILELAHDHLERF